MKNFILSIFVILVVFVSLNSCGSPSTSDIAKANIERMEREAFVRDSVARAKFVRDSIAMAEHNAEVIARCAPLFNSKKDEFSNRTWIEPKTAPKYRNQNGVYCYFATEGGKASTNFRFVYQYHADDWLFIKSLVFNIDDDIVTIVPDMETDCNYTIWEWCDESVNYNTAGIDEDFIKKIANAKSVKVKMNGSQYYDTRTLTASQIKSIKDAYEYFLALGGTFNSEY